MSKRNNTKDLVSYFPGMEKPCEDYASLRDACFEDFITWESYESQAYVDCLGHLTVGVGTLLYNRKSGEKKEEIEGEEKSRFDLCGYTVVQKNALIKATKLLSPRDYMNIKTPDDVPVQKVVTKVKEGKVYRIVVEKIPRAGARIISVQEGNNPVVKIPQIGREQYRQVFNATFSEYYEQTKNTVKDLHNLPRSLQTLSVHQTYARGVFPEGVKINSIETAYQSCADSIAFREKYGVPEAERTHLQYCKKVIEETRNNERRKIIVVDCRPKSNNQEWVQMRQKHLEERILNREALNQKTDNLRVARRFYPYCGVNNRNVR